MNAFICNTPVQIMRAVQIKRSLPYFKDNADIYILVIFLETMQ